MVRERASRIGDRGEGRRAAHPEGKEHGGRRAATSRPPRAERPEPEGSGGPVRLQKILSSAGVASRRAAEQLITEGRVSVNGSVVRELGTKADPEADEIRVDGRQIKRVTRRLYFLLNKPRGYVTTRSDPEGRRTVLDLLSGVHDYVFPVGRLDYDSEGLLLLTNDGELAAQLTHPSHEVEREYHARIRGVPDAHGIARLTRGILLDGRRTAPATVRVVGRGLGDAGDQSLLSIILHEGRTRQVRRMCEAIGHPVVRLRRVRIGPISDPAMPLGAYRLLTPREVAALRRIAKKEPKAQAPVPGA